MSNCCMRRPAKFHVDSAVSFWAIANIREGGGQGRRQGLMVGEAHLVGEANIFNLK